MDSVMDQDADRASGGGRDLIKRLRDASVNPALSIGLAWNLLDEAADALTGLSEAATELERGAPEGWVLVPADPGACELDDSGWVLTFMRELHGNVETNDRPNGWSDFSDEQRERIKAAYRAMIAAAPPPPAQEVP